MPGHYKRKSRARKPQSISKSRSRMRIMPVPVHQLGMGHCQCGDGFFDDLVSGIGDLVTFKDPVRSLAGIATLGLSEGVLGAEKITGKKGSQLIDSSRKLATLIGVPELAVPAEIVSTGLKAIGHGRKRKRKSVKRNKKGRRK